MNIFIEFYLPMIVALSFAVFFFVLHQRRRHQSHLHTDSSIAQLVLLRALIADLQRHRGLSNVVLSGDRSMAEDLAKTCQLVDQHISAAQALRSTQHESWRGVIDHWSRMREGRSSDQENNLKQHNLIIRNCIFLVEDIADQVDLSGGNMALNYLPCIWREVIPAAEWTGQARALGASIVAAGYSTPAQRVRLQFLYEKIEHLSSEAFHTLNHHLQMHPRSNGFRLNGREAAMGAFLNCVKLELLSTAAPKIDTKAYFLRATHAIDELLTLVDVALEQINEHQSKRR